MDAELARLSVVLDARLDKFEAQMNKAVRSSHAASSKIEKAFNKQNIGKGLQAHLDGIAKSSMFGSTALTTLGAAGLGLTAVLAGVTVTLKGMSDALKFADDLEATAEKVGVTAERLQELRFAAEESDVPIADLESGLQKLNAALGALKLGKGDAKIKAFAEELGIDKASLRDVQDASELLPLLADRLSEVKTRAEQVRIAKALGIEELLPLLRKGSAGLAEMTDKARALGLVMSNDLTAEAADAHRQLEILQDMVGTRLTIAFAKLSSGILGTSDDLDDLAKKFDEMVVKARDALLQVAGFWQGIREKSTPASGTDWIPGSTLVADFARGQEDRFRGMADMWASDRGPRRTGGSGTPQGSGFAGGYTPPRRAFRSTDDDKEGRGRGRSAKAAQEFVDAFEIIDVNSEDTQAIRDRIKVLEELLQLGGRVAEFDGSPNLNDAAPTDLVQGPGKWLMTEDERAAAQDQWASIIHGAFYALKDGGWQGLADYFAQTLTDSLIEKMSTDLAAMFMEFARGSGGGGGEGTNWFAAAANAFAGFFAGGGTIPPGQYGIVGENGPEIARGGAGGLSIGSNATLRALSNTSAGDSRAGGGAGGVNVMVSLSGAKGDRELARLTELAVARGVARGIAINNRNEPGRTARTRLLGTAPR